MKDKKTIWHEPIDIPQNEKELVIKTERCGYESYKLSYNEDTGRYAPWSWVQKDVEKWCYLDDLLSLSDRVDELEKALEVAKTRIALYADDDFVDDTLSAIDKVLKSSDTITKDTKDK